MIRTVMLRLLPDEEAEARLRKLLIYLRSSGTRLTMLGGECSSKPRE
ncbi:MAG: hypothetical protein QXQ57_07955 [Sulfolobales archaeon]